MVPIFMVLIKPKALEPGDTIGIITPSSPLTQGHLASLRKNMEVLEGSGYIVKLGANLRRRYGHKAGRADQRLEELHAMFEDDGVNAIFASRGGYNSNELLDMIDYDLVRNNPKIFCGYSDITSLHIALHTQTGLVTFHGPNATTRLKLQGGADDYTLANFQNVVTNTITGMIIYQSQNFTYGTHIQADLRVENQKPTKWVTLREGSAKGRLMGGNLLTLLNLGETRYFPDFKDTILFWEDTETSTTFTDRFLQQMKMAGIFEDISGMIVGRMNIKQYETVTGNYGLHKIILDATKGYDFPIIADMDFGHTMPMFTIPYGIEARIYAHRKPIFELLEPAVRK